ncbi:uncharacterized protein LOC115229305 [Octopus sinensis]|uniref:Uncharacterized protein LOC115229305 n=1 Tax=Octopus sinensis TaxID=2607531 RepID=A0A6P7TTC2_9MOLL|nr:uncharacterized protein LOC115229305 [Octopus sinensis]
MVFVRRYFKSLDQDFEVILLWVISSKLYLTLLTPTPESPSKVLLKDSEWLWKLAFSADLTMHLNDFNLRIQGETSLICDLYSKVKAFRKKLILFESQLTRSCFTHFSRCDKYRQEAATPFPNLFAQDVILALKQQFEERFSDLDACSSKLRILKIHLTLLLETYLLSYKWKLLICNPMTS